MKKIVILMVLAIACTKAKLIAQGVQMSLDLTNKSITDINALPPTALFRHKFTIHLNNENRVIVQLNKMLSLEDVMNIDSIIKSVLNDIGPLKDSLQTTFNTKKVSYTIDSTGFKSIGISNYEKDKTYTVTDNDIAILKIGQDTLLINKLYTYQIGTTVYPGFYQWQITVILNNLEEANNYTNGVLNSTMQKIESEYKQQTGWKPKKENKTGILADYYPYDKTAPGRASYRNKSFIVEMEFFGEVAVQNIADKFVPSFKGPSVGFVFNSNNVSTSVKISTEVYSVFTKNALQKTSVSQNSFINVAFSRKRNNDGWWNAYFLNNYLLKNISLGYLSRRRGDFLEKNTFKLQLSSFEYKSVSLTPQFFFNDFFKNMTPSVRLAVSF